MNSNECSLYNTKNELEIEIKKLQGDELILMQKYKRSIGYFPRYYIIKSLKLFKEKYYNTEKERDDHLFEYVLYGRKVKPYLIINGDVSNIRNILDTYGRYLVNNRFILNYNKIYWSISKTKTHYKCILNMDYYFDCNSNQKKIINNLIKTHQYTTVLDINNYNNGYCILMNNQSNGIHNRRLMRCIKEDEILENMLVCKYEDDIIEKFRNISIKRI